ncbi:winged helix-turn-helix domain-containing protein [Burkholderia vietnamiensis]|uniref:winged helix-turn-helix domain-containing protein n=1 Tax=Burkholderia vietnamiensis TaxID=60552 RepID=UPI000751C93D|nr:winged helix-turn-helix domain-containing protein [Burkholderia vietnamiensis]KVR93305.1 hypothetical protein WK28_16015 [Burkholderia vietnamiensis]
MAEGKMGFTSRRICECLRDNPDISMATIANKLDANIETIKKPVRRLVELGYVKQGARRKDGFTYRLTGKPFPSSADWKVTPAYAATLQRRAAFDDAFSVVIPAMRAMVDVGRVAA